VTDLMDIDTPSGPARAHLRAADGDGPARGALLLGHGAGGSVDAPDLKRVTAVARELGLLVALVEQPYRVAGKRSTPRAPVLDAAWTAVVDALRDGPLDDLPFVAGGRSSGARVACRTAAETGAAGVLCLAFPLVPPLRSPSAEPQTRLPELDGVRVPTLVVQGANDRFGMPPARRGRKVVEVRGDHGLKSDLEAVGSAARTWLAQRF
jgi:predicted alpha/beta-hydrolase family hydrolase